MAVSQEHATWHVKNTFLTVEEEEECAELAVRASKSVPVSFQSAAAAEEQHGGWVSFPDPEDEDAAVPQVVAVPDKKADALELPTLMGKSGKFRVKAVTFMLHADCSEALQPQSTLTVKNTFLTVQEPMQEAFVRPTKSVPDSFAPEASCPKDGDEHGEGEGERDGEASPALCHLRTLSVGATPQGPHLGLLWAPAGRSWPAQPQEQEQASPAQQPEEAAAAPARPLEGGVASGPAGLAGRVWALSQDAQGCREVQRALDEARSDAEREALARELKGHVWEALRSPHANHVLQKCVTVLPAEALGFIVEELLPSSGAQAARHKYGCRIVQRLVEKVPHQVTGLVDSILADFAQVARHPYGNYVAQNLLQYAADAQRMQGYRLIAKDIRGLASDSFGSAVVSCALSKGNAAGQLEVARALVREPGLLVFVACTRHGHVAATKVLQVLQGAEREEAWRRLSAEAESLKASRFGRVVAGCL